MNILMVCSELAPLAKTGGLADAVTGLSGALCERGHDVRVLLPHYSSLESAAVGQVASPDGRFKYAELEPGKAATPVAATRRRGRREALRTRIYALDLRGLTGDRIYLDDVRDAGRFLRLADAALPLCAALDWRPDVLHCHDWHAALVPVAQRASAADPIPTVLTLHNIGYQGVFPDSVLELYGRPELRSVLASDALAGGTINFLRAGLRAADVLTTVSPTYAAEIRTPAYGMGLEDVLEERGAELVGILNGVDYNTWGPDADPFIEVRYDAANVAPKYRLKGALSLRVGLVPDQNAPLIGVVSRLAPQKGIDLVTAILPALLRETRANFVFLGNGDAATAAELRRFATANPRRVSFTDDYDEPLAHQIFAGSDLFLVPSRYEPCGLTQMYALRYGTIPVVRATGGLADTIQHFDPASGTGNGSVFRDADPDGLLWGVRSALAWFDDPDAWSRLIANAMAADFSWRKQVRPYEDLYRGLAG
jgi:starch synthase